MSGIEPPSEESAMTIYRVTYGQANGESADFRDEEFRNEDLAVHFASLARRADYLVVITTTTV
jgi:hypothetical protein